MVLGAQSTTEDYIRAVITEGVPPLPIRALDVAISGLRHKGYGSQRACVILALGHIGYVTLSKFGPHLWSNIDELSDVNLLICPDRWGGKKW